MSAGGAGGRRRADALAAACSLLLSAIAALCLAEVALRYGFGSGLGFYDELAGYLLVWLSLLGAVMARRDRAHIGFPDLVKRLPRRARLVATGLEHAVVLGLHLVIAWYGGVLALRFASERAITLPAPMGLFYFVLPLFATLTAVLEGRRLVGLFRSAGPGWTTR